MTITTTRDKETNSVYAENIKETQALSTSAFKRSIPTHNYSPRVDAFPKFEKNELGFIAFLAHEVRNPLVSINLCAEMLMQGSLDKQQKKYLDIILRNSLRINDLITRLLTYQKPEKEEASHSVNGLLDEVLNIVEDRIKLKSITVIKAFSIDDFVIMANEEKMKIAFTNIIINAIDAMPFATGILKLNGKYVEGRYVMEIEDNGCGINSQHLGAIFDGGFTDKPGGLGFGLQITKTILLANNVEIKVTSNEGEFTRFILIFNNYLADKEGIDI